MTPFEIEICLYHSYKGNSPVVFNHWFVPIGPATYDGLVANDLLKQEENFNEQPLFSGTDKLEAYVRMLQSTPLPEKKFIDPRSGVVILRST